MIRWREIIKGLYLKWKIESTEKKLCKYVSKFTGINVISVKEYRKGAVKE